VAEAARYAQIAAELRRRIEQGELAPGSRVPSTREITARWGVAMATATRVLATLREAGLVRAVPGVGTVVAERAGAGSGGAGPGGAGPGGAGPGGAGPGGAGPGGAARATAPAGRRVHPGAAQIVAAAVAIADAEGLGALSMRRVAAQAGAATMSLYRHVADKDDLVTQMTDAVLAQWQLPGDPPPGWRARLELAARHIWAMFREHPWLAPAMSLTRPEPLPSGLPLTEWVLTALDGLGLSLSEMFTAHLMLFNYVRGTAVNLESEAEAQAASGLDSDQWMAERVPELESVIGGGFPLLGQVVASQVDVSLDALFEFGLQRLLDGLAAMLPPRAGAG
jgi:AcrR family transcriptional regulator